MEIHPIDERIRELCQKVQVAQGPELERILSELRAALREHSDFVRYMALQSKPLVFAGQEPLKGPTATAFAKMVKGNAE